MSRSGRTLGISLAFMVTTAIALPAASSAGASPAPAVGSQPGHGQPVHPAGGTPGDASTPVPAPATHALGSKVVVPTNWSIVPTPSVGTTVNQFLDGVSCVTSSFCMSVGYAEGSFDQTLVEGWNGASWSVVSSPNTSSSEDNELNSVSCVTVSFCMAVGSVFGATDQTLAEQWDGTNWKIVTSPNTSTSEDNDLSAVSCKSQSFCIAVGRFNNGTNEQTLVERWDGTSWSIVTSPNPSASGDNELDGVDCVSASFCQAVGGHNSGSDFVTLVEQWNGSTWSTVGSPNNSTLTDQRLNAVSCSGNSFCVAVGWGATNNGPANIVEQWDGTKWTLVAAPDANINFGDLLLDVDCFGPTSCVAAGYVNTIDNSDSTYVTQMLTWNGVSWQLVNVPEPDASAQEDQVNGLSCVAGAMCVGAGYATYGSNTTIQPMVLSAPIARPGYDEVASDGGIFNFGGAGFYGSLGSLVLNQPIVGMARTPDGGGYWLVASDGGIFAEGDAGFFGSMGGQPLNKPIVGMAATPDGQGYWLVASDGGIFSFGTAAFHGSMGGQPLNKPIVGMAAAPDGQGYWLVASDGGIFSFGTAAFHGSMGGTPLNKPIVGMASTSDGAGYWLVASDGGIFSEGDAGFFGSEGGTVLNKPVVGMAATADDQGYWLVATDGGIFAKGDANFAGSMGGTPLNKPIVGMGA